MTDEIREYSHNDVRLERWPMPENLSLAEWQGTLEGATPGTPGCTYALACVWLANARMRHPEMVTTYEAYIARLFSSLGVEPQVDNRSGWRHVMLPRESAELVDFDSSLPNGRSAWQETQATLWQKAIQARAEKYVGPPIELHPGQPISNLAHAVAVARRIWRENAPVRVFRAGTDEEERERIQFKRRLARREIHDVFRRLDAALR